MSTLEEYKSLGQDLIDYVSTLGKQGNHLLLQESFKSGGKLFDVMQMLKQKENLIHNYGEQLLAAFDSN